MGHTLHPSQVALFILRLKGGGSEAELLRDGFSLRQYGWTPGSIIVSGFRLRGGGGGGGGAAPPSSSTGGAASPPDCPGDEEVSWFEAEDTLLLMEYLEKTKPALPRRRLAALVHEAHILPSYATLDAVATLLTGLEEAGFIIAGDLGALAVNSVYITQDG
jgi:hypothetical protein